MAEERSDALSPVVDQDAEPLQQPQADLVPLKEIDNAPGSEEIDHYQKSSIDAERAYEDALQIALDGKQEGAVQKFLQAAKIAEMAHEWHLAALALEQVGNYLSTPGGVYNLVRAFRLYRRAVMSYELCGLFSEARELTYRIMYLKLLRGKELDLRRLERIELFFFWASSGFGTRPLRVVGMALLLVVLYGCLYWAIEGVEANHAGQRATLADALYFSGITFVTVGYGDFLPAAHARLLAMTEGALGVISMSYFVVVLSNRLGKH